MCCIDIYKKLIYDLCKKIIDKATYDFLRIYDFTDKTI